MPGSAVRLTPPGTYTTELYCSRGGGTSAHEPARRIPLNAKISISSPRSEVLGAISASGTSVPLQSPSLNHCTPGRGAILHSRRGNPYGLERNLAKREGLVAWGCCEDPNRARATASHPGEAPRYSTMGASFNIHVGFPLL